jgi:hypothetical protein
MFTYPTRFLETRDSIESCGNRNRVEKENRVSLM